MRKLVVGDISYFLPGGSGALQVWQKHCITESLTSPINILHRFSFKKFSKKFVKLSLVRFVDD